MKLKWDRNTTVRLTQKLRSGDILEDLGFENCRIEGPAIVVPTAGSEISHCDSYVPGGRRTLVAKKIGPGEPAPAGVIYLRNVHFVRCTLHNISFVGDETFLNGLYLNTETGLRLE